MTKLPRKQPLSAKSTCLSLLWLVGISVTLCCCIPIVDAFSIPHGRERLRIQRKQSQNVFHHDRTTSQSLPSSLTATTTTTTTQLRSSMNNNNDNEQAIEAMHSLVDFHQGQWNGRARSFTVTPDIAAGIVQRKQSPEYRTRVTFGTNTKNGDYTMSELMEWEATEEQQQSDDKKEHSSVFTASRSLSFSDSNVDVDVVDGSYSLDGRTAGSFFPVAIVGTEKQQHFILEHCLATSDNGRMRCLAIYDGGDTDHSLIRVVLCEELRASTSNDDEEEQQKGAANKDASKLDNSLTVGDIIEMKSEVDRLVDRITGGGGKTESSSAQGAVEDSRERLKQFQSGSMMSSKSSSSSSSPSLVPHPASLLELSSGLWLGDCVIRDHPMVPLSPLERGGGKRKGFGASSSSSSGITEQQPFNSPPPTFADWSVGVQKVAWRWMWNFGDEIRQVNDAGKSMGAELAILMMQQQQQQSYSVGGSVCVNEGLSRRIPKDDRMVYINWDGERVGFLLGSAAIQLPRYWPFLDQTSSSAAATTGRLKPFYTEFSVFQRSTAGDASDEEQLPDIICSKMSRFYNYEGLLRQGCTSFFTFKRFGVGEEE